MSSYQEHSMWQTYYSPTSLDETLRLLAKHGPEARLIAGGTDLLVEMRHGIRPAPILIDTTRFGADRIWLDDKGWVHLDPAVTHNQVVASELLAERALPLAQACWQIGSPPLRNRATVVGNLVTASPANDTITALWALEARLTLANAHGQRTLSFADFYRGVRRTAAAPDEMVTDVAFPALRPDQRGVFVKLGLRRTHAIALVTAAAVLTFAEDTVSQARITLGSVAPTIIRVPEAEGLLVGQALDPQLAAEAAGLAARTAVPIDDVRASAHYRREMVAVLVRRALTALGDSSERAALPDAPPKLWGRGDGRFPYASGQMVCHQEGDANPIEFTVNGKKVLVQGAAGKTLLQMLRDDLGLTGAKEGCGEGECGACTVWMDDMAVLACLVPAPRAHGTRIVTVEGLAGGGVGAVPHVPAHSAGATTLHPVQQAFLDTGAVQCGFCTPGFIMSGANLLEEVPHPTREQIVIGLSGNLCRCTGYYKIIQAIEEAAQAR
jgi:xanthine dehydrogenase iron-sulfur cluster and FAD-binding subunit A